jgi:hypothetical protein
MRLDLFGTEYDPSGAPDPNDIPGRFGISFNRLKELLEVNPEEGWAKRKFNSYGNIGHEAERGHPHLRLIWPAAEYDEDIPF